MGMIIKINEMELSQILHGLGYVSGTLEGFKLNSPRAVREAAVRETAIKKINEITHLFLYKEFFPDDSS